MTWWWLWDGFLLGVLMLNTLAALTKKQAVEGALGVCLCWLAFLRVLSSYGAW
jgi:hypothetical protein